MLGGFAALAESAWMGTPLTTDILEPVRMVTRKVQAIRPAVPPLREISLRRLLTREYSIAEASFILMASFFSSALLGAVRQIMFNAQFGVGPEVNAYYAAFRLPDTLFSLVAGGALSSAMIPVLLTTTREEGTRAGARLVSLILTSLVAFFVLVVAALEVFAPQLVRGALAPGFDEPTSELTVTLTRIMLIQPMILAVGTVATAVLNSRNQFMLPALAVITHNVALILGILAARFVPGVGIYGPTFGVVGGALLQGLVLVPAMLADTPDLRPVLDLANRRLREVVRLLIPNGVSVAVNYSGFIVDTAFASRAPQVAGLPALYNAWLLVGLPVALLGQAVGQAAFPRLAAAADEGAYGKMRRTVVVSLGAVIALAVPAMLALIFLGRPVIAFLFERGKFDASAGALTYTVLVAYAVALPFYVGTELITRGLIALRDTRTPLATNTAQLLGRAGIMAAFISSWGIVAIPVALAITASIETVVLGIVLFVKMQRRMREPQLAPLPETA
jgi:putative peptidoglycan lipid II flippase